MTAVAQLNDDDFMTVFYDMFDSRGAEVQRTVSKNILKRSQRRAKQREVPGRVGVMNPPSYPVDQPRPCSSREASVSAFKVVDN